MPNQPDPAVLSCCFFGAFRKAEEKEVGIFPLRPVLFWIAMDDGIFNFLAAPAASNPLLFYRGWRLTGCTSLNRLVLLGDAVLTGLPR